MKKGFKIFLLALTATLPALAGSFYAGSDTGCFYAHSKSNCTVSSSKTSLGVAVGGGPLFFAPDSGFTAPTIAGGTVDLGVFNINKTLLGGKAGTFDIDITFTAPAGAGGKTFSGSTLAVVALGKSGLEITFNHPTTQVFTYPGGAFDLSLPSSTILIGAGKSYTLDGVIAQCSTTSTPEPIPLAAIGLGLIAMALLARRRAVSRRTSIL